MKSGAFIGEYASPTADPIAPHLIFSISKSLTAILAGILQNEGLLDPAKLVAHYIPEAKGSAYEEATVRQVLDMRVSVDFVEDYHEPEGDFTRYRRAMLWNPLRPDDKPETLAGGNPVAEEGGRTTWRRVPLLFTQLGSCWASSSNALPACATPICSAKSFGFLCAQRAAAPSPLIGRARRAVPAAYR